MNRFGYVVVNGITMTNSINIKNIDDLMYMVDSSFECLKQNEYNKIHDEYHKRLKKHEKQITSNKSLFLYDYRPPLIDFENSDLKPMDHFTITDPAIQTVRFNDNSFIIKGNGKSYMNYIDYNFEIHFSNTTNFVISNSQYSNNQKSTETLNIDDFNKKLSKLYFKEVFLDRSATLSNEICFVFMNYEDFENRTIILIQFEYHDLNIQSFEISS